MAAAAVVEDILVPRLVVARRTSAVMFLVVAAVASVAAAVAALAPLVNATRSAGSALPEGPLPSVDHTRF